MNKNELETFFQEVAKSIKTEKDLSAFSTILKQLCLKHLVVVITHYLVLSKNFHWNRDFKIGRCNSHTILAGIWRHCGRVVFRAEGLFRCPKHIT